jgi:hypothetical protein
MLAVNNKKIEIMKTIIFFLIIFLSFQIKAQCFDTKANSHSEFRKLEIKDSLQTQYAYHKNGIYFFTRLNEQMNSFCPKEFLENSAFTYKEIPINKEDKLFIEITDLLNKITKN